MECIICGEYVSPRRRSLIVRYGAGLKGIVHPGCLYLLHERTNTDRTDPAVSRYWVYLLRCADSSIYVGMTSNIVRRLSEHRRGSDAPYVKRRMPFTFLGAIPLATQRDAHQVEWRLWRMPSRQRLRFAEAHGLRPPDEVFAYDAAFILSGQTSWYVWVIIGAFDNP